MRDFNTRDLERNILSAVLNDAKTVYMVADRLKSEDFCGELNKDVFAAFLALNAERIPIDVITVESKLKMMDKEYLVREKYVYELCELLASAAGIEFWIGQLKELSLARKLNAMYDNLKNLLNEGTCAVKDVLNKNSEWLSEMALSLKEKDFRSAVAINEEIVAELQSGKPLLGFATGFMQLDHLMKKGLRNKQMIVLAAPPSVGKTAFALNISLKLAFEGKNVCVINMEMDDKDLQIRNICARAMVNSDIFVTRTFNVLESLELQKALKDTSLPNLRILDSYDLSIEEIVRKCELQKLRNGLDFLVIDYINLIRIENENRAIGVGEVSRRIKVLAGNLNIPVLVLAQMNREMFRKNEEPDLHHLRDSGNIEQDADAVWFMTRKNKSDRKTEFKIAKNRNGRTGNFALEYVGENFLFRDWTVAPGPDSEGFFPPAPP